MKKITNRIHYSWIVVVMCCLIIMAGSLTSAAVAPNMMILRTARGFTAQQTSYVTICITLSSLIISMPFFHRIVTTFGVRKSVLVALLLESGVFTLWGFCGKSLVLFYLGAVVNGIVLPYTGALPIFTILINRWFNKNRGTALGIVCAGTGLANFVWSPIISSILEKHGDLMVFLTEAAFMAVVAIVQFLVIRETPEEMGLEALGGKNFTVESKKAQFVNKINRKDLTNTGFIFLMVAAVLVGYTAGSCSQQMTNHFVFNGFEKSVASSAVSIYGIVLVFSKIYLGRFKDRYGMAKTTFVFFIIQILGILLCVSSRWITNTAILFIATAVYAVGAPVQMLSTPNWSEDFSQGETTLKYTERTHMGYLAGQVIGAFITGRLADATGHYTLPYIIFACSIAVAGLIVACLYISRKKHSKA